MEYQEIILNVSKDESEVVSIDVTFPIVTKSDGGCFFVQCPAFKTLGFSKVSLEEAIKDHEIDLTIFFKVHISRSTLKSALNNLGWKRKNDN